MSRQHFMARDLELLESGVLADATITCGDRTWKVHKSIIRRCDWFNKAFTGGFEEALTNKVNISAEDFSSEVVDCAISFIYSGVVNIEKLDTNDSVADACVRLWAIADFLILKELKDEAIKILETYCDEKMKMICPIRENKPFSNSRNCDVLLLQLFRGVETAYAQYPHSVPCQQALVNFFHGIRALVFAKQSFFRAMSKAPLQFSHELFMATIGGRESRWTLEKLSDFKSVIRTGDCTCCKDNLDNHPRSFVVDPSMSELSKAERSHKVRWRCDSCFEKHGFERCRVDDKEHERAWRAD